MYKAVGVAWTHLVEDRDKCILLTSAVSKKKKKNMGNFLTS